MKAFVPDLRHEGVVYRQFEALQGVAIPVCLGNMDLNRTYYLDVGVRIVHMLYMAWGGDCLEYCSPWMPPSLLQIEKERSMNEVYRLGVLHQDIRPANMLWNRETRRVVVIDFERSVLCRSLRPRGKSLEGTSCSKTPRQLQRMESRKSHYRLEGKLGSKFFHHIS